MARDKLGKIPDEAFEGDYTDPRKSKEVDSHYSREYLERRAKQTAEWAARLNRSPASRRVKE